MVDLRTINPGFYFYTHSFSFLHVPIFLTVFATCRCCCVTRERQTKNLDSSALLQFCLRHLDSPTFDTGAANAPRRDPADWQWLKNVIENIESPEVPFAQFRFSWNLVVELTNRKRQNVARDCAASERAAQRRS